MRVRAKELRPSEFSMDKFVASLADNLTNELFNRALKDSPSYRSDLETTALGKSGNLLVRQVAPIAPLHPHATGTRPRYVPSVMTPTDKDLPVDTQGKLKGQSIDVINPLAPEKKVVSGGFRSTLLQDSMSTSKEVSGANTKSRIAQLERLLAENIKEMPWWWDDFWKLPFTKAGTPGEPLKLGDTMRIFKANIEQVYGDCPPVDGAPLADADISDLTDGTMYLGLQSMYQNYGGIFKLCFGPKSFMVISDPTIMRHVLQDRQSSYDKGVLAEILEPIMGKGLIPADPETNKIRRRAIVPGFHKKWINRMVGLFGEETSKAMQVLDQAADAGKTVDVEERLGSLALDIIGRAIFDYDFNSTNAESPVVKAAISTLKEAEHRSMTPFPYWKIPFATDIVPRQVEFKKNMALLNNRLDECIQSALMNRNEEDVEALQNRDYSSMENPSMLRFMVDMRDEDTTCGQLRDDLMTMLIAGHETTASALTWAIFELTQYPKLLKRLQAEVDKYLPDVDSIPTLETLKAMQLTRLTIAESLRMYPEPPLLIRRALEEDTLPVGGTNKEVKILRGMDIFISIYNMHRSPLYWDNPDTFDPDRFTRRKESTEPGWKGFDPDKWMKGGQWYPTENSADWAYLPFGGGPRKCVGDQFAMLEATVALACLVRRYEFEFAYPTATPDQVGTATGATIHTKNGMWMKVKKRQKVTA